MEGDNPSTRKRGFSPSKPPTFPSTAWGGCPKTRRSAAHCLPSFLRKLALIPFAICRGVFDFQKNFYYFLGTFSTFKNTFVASPTQFRSSKELLRLPRRNFDFQKNFRAFPGAFSCFKSTFAAVFACFRPSKVLLRLTSACFLLSKVLFSIRFKQKSIH